MSATQNDEQENGLERVYAAQTREELSDAYEIWAANYDRETLSSGYHLPFAITAWLARHVEQGNQPILDVGCGTGLSAPLLRALGFSQIIGLDMSEAMLEIAAARSIYARLETACLGETLPFADASIAALFSTGVFTEGHAPASSLYELLRILMPGGKAILTVRDSVFSSNGFAAIFDAFCKSGQWIEVERSPSFRAFAIDEPDVLVSTYVFAKA